jgi:cytochrome c biogenesis protein
MKQSQPQMSDREKEKGFLSIIFGFFRTLKLTIFLLILLAVVSIIGTMIAQNAAPEEYIRRYGAPLYEILEFFNLFDMYHSWWFSAILLILVLNLIACSLERFPRVWSQISRGGGPSGLKDSTLKTLAYVEKLRIDSERAGAEMTVQKAVEKQWGEAKRIETDSGVTFFSERGRFSRLGVYIAHLSLLIILIGALIGSVYGFKGFVNIPEGGTVDRIFLRAKNAETEKALPFSLRCDDFKVSFYDVNGQQEKHVKEYTSILTVIENGKEVFKRTVQVNHPLHYRGLAFYQSSYGAVNTIRLGIQKKNAKEKTIVDVGEGDMVQTPELGGYIRVLRYAQQVHNLGEGVQVALLRPNQQPRIFWVVKGPAKPEQEAGEEFMVTFEGVSSKEYTGLQVTKDPGVWIVWLGCAIMMLGFVVSFFFSHQRVWARLKNTELILAGSANKNLVGFEKRFQQLVSELRTRLSRDG